MQLDENGHGIVLIDKPQSWTSHDVVSKMRRITGIKKIGHSGTLDPLATGLLILLVGKKFTKQQEKFLKLDKEYTCTALFGTSTDSYDITGNITAQTSWETLQKLDATTVEKGLSQFRGDILQTVPAFSAVKVKGKKLYQLARKGEAKKEQLPTKTVTIHSFILDTFTTNKAEQSIYATFTIQCSSGTYIRSLIHDLGNTLGVGGTIAALRRTKIGQYSVENARKIEKSQEKNHKET